MSNNDETFYSYMSWIADYCKNKGLKGMVVRFEALEPGYSVVPLLNKDDVDKAMNAKFSKKSSSKS
jgi:hypothetical protein